MNNETMAHYDLLIDEGNDPVLDPPELQEYMDKWDGQLFLDLLELNQSKSVLEIGCGTGRIAVKVASFVKSFCGVDISPKTIEAAKKHLTSDNTNFICDDFLNYRFSQKFDVIYSSLTFMHIQDKAKAITKVRDLLLHGGRFVLSIDKNRDNELNYGTRSIRIYPDTTENIIDLLKENDFVTITKHETEFACIISAIWE